MAPAAGAICVAVAALSAVAIAGASIAIGVATGVVAAMAVLLAWQASLAYAANGRALGIRSPSLLIFGFLALIYVARPAYVLATGVLGTTTIGIRDADAYALDILSTLIVLLLSVAGFALAYELAPVRLSARVLLVDQPRRLRSTAPVLLLLLLILGVGTAWFVFKEMNSFPGGLQVALTVRNRFFAGRTYLTWMMDLYKLGLIGAVAAWVGVHGLRFRTVLVILVLWSPTLAFDTLGGSRAELLLRNLLPLAAVLSAGARWTWRSALTWVGLMVVLAALFVGYRTVVRDPATGTSRVLTTALFENLTGAFGFVLAGDEASAFDYLTVTRVNVPANIPFRGAETVRAVLLAPLPSAIIPDKPLRAGTVLTQKLEPLLYARGGNLAFSGASDLYYTAGDATVFFGFIGLGLIAGALLRGAATRGIAPWALAVGFFGASAILSVIRADLFELPFVVVRVGLLVLLYRLVTEPTAPTALMAHS